MVLHIYRECINGKEIDMTKTTDLEQITEFLKDPIIVRIVRILDITSLSILELLEYDLTRKDINHALSNGVIKIDKSASSASAHEDAIMEMCLLVETIIFTIS